jgi:hypothetical protein
MRSIALLTLALALAACSKGDDAKCGAGTVLKDGVCVVATGASASAPQAALLATPAKPAAPLPSSVPSMSCPDACKKLATCKGLNAEAPLVASGCSDLCKDVDSAAKDLKEGYLLCVEKSDCSTAGRCAEAFSKATAPKPRDSKDTDAVIVTKQSVNTGDYGVGKELRTTYKNNTDKPVDGVKFVYFCFNNFDDQIATGRLISQDTIKARDTDHGNWRIFEDGCTKAKVSVTEVHFKDGSKWTSE